MTVHTYEHRNGGRVIPAALQHEVKHTVAAVQSLSSSSGARDGILNTLRNKCGWSDEVKLCADAKISITSQKASVGLCMQTGNMSRFYADLIKLEYLFKESRITSAIYILPVKELAKAWGENIANYERLTNEVGLFSKIINVPLLIIGISER